MCAIGPSKRVAEGGLEEFDCARTKWFASDLPTEKKRFNSIMEPERELPIRLDFTFRVISLFLTVTFFLDLFRQRRLCKIRQRRNIEPDFQLVTFPVELYQHYKEL